jgi:hypothetical protein
MKTAISAQKYTPVLVAFILWFCQLSMVQLTIPTIHAIVTIEETIATNTNNTFLINNPLILFIIYDFVPFTGC